MRKSDLLKLLILIIVPGSILIWVFYKLYESFNRTITSDEINDTLGPVNNTKKARFFAKKGNE